MKLFRVNAELKEVEEPVIEIVVDVDIKAESLEEAFIKTQDFLGEGYSIWGIEELEEGE